MEKVGFKKTKKAAGVEVLEYPVKEISSVLKEPVGKTEHLEHLSSSLAAIYV